MLDSLLREVVGAGATVVLASHDASVTEALADRVVTMSGGTVVDGSPAPDEPASAPEGAGPSRPDREGTISVA
jgi:ABC-type glutathione transport system ATPase component